jgi:hypothetical protein
LGRRGSLAPDLLDSSKLLREWRVERLAYRIALTPDLVGTHNVFHVSILRKYIANLDVIVEYEPLEI